MANRFLLTIAVLLIGSTAAQAHDPGLSSAKLLWQDSILHCTLTYAPGDAEAMNNGDKPDETQLRSLASQSLQVWFDGKSSNPQNIAVHSLANRDVEFVMEFRPPAASRLRVRSTLLDRLPFGHRQYFELDGAHGAILLEKLLSAAAPEAEAAIGEKAVAATPPASHPFSEFLLMGVKHILTGYDHLLFLFAVLIGCKKISSIVKVITAFTVAHSISLALATLGWVEIPSRIIEPMIAASIVYVGIENIICRQGVNHRALLTFAFGLIHGFGFAGALREMGVGINGGAVAVPLLAFNSGVEIGQMMVAAVILPVLWHFKDKPQFTMRWAPACSMLVAMAGAFWFVQRVWFS